MKCPKCGYNSFEYYDVCKKCANDLVGYKQSLSITATIIPAEAKAQLAAELYASEAEAEHTNDIDESPEALFSFDLPNNTPSVSAASVGDPFDFDDPAISKSQSAQQQSEDVFGDLLGTSSQADSSPFGGGSPEAASSGSARSGQVPESGEFNLDDFSWDDSSDEQPSSSPAGVVKTDDFDSLFGDMKDNKSK
jgi:hypothetical protein